MPRYINYNTPVIIHQVPFGQEPYYPPGYAAYVPQNIFRCGDTFGRATQKILLDDKVAKSKNTVLSNIVPPRLSRSDRGFEHTRNVEHLKKTWGDAKYVDPMVPGYAGHIPMRDEFHGADFTKCSANSRHMFEKMTEGASTRPGKSSSKYFMANTTPAPLRRLEKPRPTKRKHPLPTDLSVIGDKPVTFPASYAGFIPRLKDRFSQAYRTLTHDAIKEFVHDTHRQKSLHKRPVSLQRQSQRLHETDRQRHLPIYREEGQMPSYKGYLPGHPFRSGQTYNASSRIFYHEPSRVGIL